VKTVKSGDSKIMRYYPLAVEEYILILTGFDWKG
jgi:hypothetical protein